MYRSETLISIGLLLTVSLVSGCGSLSDNAQKSADNSGRAADATQLVLQTTQDAYGDGRQAGSRTRRLEEINRLEQAQTIDGKLVAASAYFYSFEFQLWKQAGATEDTDAKRQVLMAEAVTEFLETARDYEIPTSAGDNPNFTALALSMHQINTRQTAAAQTYKFQPKSMLDLVQDGLSSQASVDAGKVKSSQLPLYQLEVQKQEPVAIHLLQTRYGGLIGGIVQALAKPDTELANVAMMQDQREHLLGARQTRQVLGVVGAGVVLPAPLVQAAKSIPLPVAVASDLRTKKQGELISALKAEVGP